LNNTERQSVVTLRLNVNQEDEGLVIVNILGNKVVLSVSELKAGDAEVSLDMSEAKALLNALGEAIRKLE